MRSTAYFLSEGPQGGGLPSKARDGERKKRTIGVIRKGASFGTAHEKDKAEAMEIRKTPELIKPHGWSRGERQERSSGEEIYGGAANSLKQG